MRILDLGKYNIIIYALIAFLISVAGVLAHSYQVSGRFTDDVTATHLIAQQARQPIAIAALTRSIALGIKLGEEVELPLNELRASVRSFDETFGHLVKKSGVQTSAGKFVRVSAINDPTVQRALQQAWLHWTQYKTALEHALRISGDLYTLDNATGTRTLNIRGKKVQQVINDVLPLQTSLQQELSSAVQLAAEKIQSNSSYSAAQLRLLQASGIVIATVLFLVFYGYIYFTLRKDQSAAARVRQETTDILNTVNEGLFLLDRDFKIGTEKSLALASIFRRDDLEGLTFEDLLRKIVPDKTLNTAKDYVSLLWGDRVNEKLVKTINPLSEVEVHFDNPAGGFDTHYLEFDFNRVKSDGALSHLLVTVNDVTRRVMLARELQESQEKAQAQLDLLMRILHVEPQELTTYLSDAEVSLKMVNTILREPAREESAFRTKIDNIYRQIHAIKGEAAALGLKTVEQRAHAFEESLSDLKQRPSISGNDFLPLVVKLDDLFNHLAQVREMMGRLVDLHQTIASRHINLQQPTSSGSEAIGDSEEVSAWLAAQASGDPREATSALEALFTGGGLQRTLDNLAQQVADNNTKRVEVKCVGLEQVPAVYRRKIKDIAIQLIRNAVVHGIESPVERTELNKPEIGRLSVEFIDHGEEGVELIVKDDGRGLQLERIKEVAMERGLITPAEAALLDPRKTMALIFRPGFSTADSVTTDAGRGAGMDMVRALVAESHGRVGLATAKGRFSKFKIWLPHAGKAAA